MPEIRALIENIERVLDVLKESGAEVVGNYSFVDKIYVPEGFKIIADDYGRITIMDKKVHESKKFIVRRKQSYMKDDIKFDKELFREEFDELKPAEEKVKDLNYIFEFARTGFYLTFDRTKFFIEMVQFIGGTIEIEAPTEGEVEKAAAALGLSLFITQSLPDAVWQVKQNI